MPFSRSLVCGDVRGNLDRLFKKASKVHKSAHGPFAALFCVGSTLADPDTGASDIDAYIKGEKQCPLPTYFIGGREHESARALLSPISDGGEVAPGLRYLGRSGVVEVSGLRVGYLSGVHSPMYFRNRTPDAARRAKYQDHYEEGDVAALIAAAVSADDGKSPPEPVDILLTSEWAKGYYKLYTPAQLPPVATQPATGAGSPVVSDVAISLAPRYHFAANERCFHKLRPYRNDNADHVTRFVGLADLRNKDKKQKSLFACNVAPLRTMDAAARRQRPENSTLCPYNYRPPAAKRPAPAGTEAQEPLKRIRLQKEDLSQFAQQQQQRFVGDYGGGARAWRWDAGVRPGARRGGGPARPARPAVPKRTDCWFCLASPKVEEHLIVSVGTEAYVAMAKGPLVPGHLIVLPIQHVSKMAELTDAQRAEMALFESAIERCFRAGGNAAVALESAIPTRNLTHVHRQLLPVAPKFLPAVETVVVEAGRAIGIDFKVLSDAKTVEEAVSGGAFLRVDLPESKKLVGKIPAGADVRPLFSLTRKAIAAATGQPGRGNWKRCLTDKNDEQRMVDAFKKQFEKFEPDVADD